MREIIPVGGYFATAVPPGLSFSNITGTFSGTPTKISAPTNYTVTAYNASGGSTAQASIQVSALTFYYNTPLNYTVGTAISPAATVVTGSVAGPAFGTTFTAPGSGFSAPNAVAVDFSGNIYVADQGTNNIKMMPAGGGTPVVKGSGFSSPSGVAVDITGNIYVADKGNGVVKKIPIAGGSITAIGTGFTTPVSVATDFLGNVYVADQGSHSVAKISYIDGSTTVLSTAFTTPNSIASDGAGNVYVSDAGTKLITELPAGGGAAVTIGSGFVAPAGVTIDALGNVFVTESAGSVKEILAGTTSPTSVATGFSTPAGIVIDLYGDLLVADAGHNAIKKVTPVGGYYISPALPAGLSLNTVTGTISGTPTAARPSLNYTASAYNPQGGNSFSVNITVAAGLAPTLIYNSGSPLTYTAGNTIAALTPVSNGVAAPGFNSTGVAVGSNFTNPRGVALDDQGNMYVADFTANTVWKFPVGGGSPVSIGSGFNGPTAVAVDMLGDVYIADYGNNAIKKIFSGQNFPIPIGSGFSHPTGIALDGAGNLYVADNGSSLVKELMASTNQVVTIGSGYAAPLSVAVDAAGNVYIGTTGTGAIKKIPAGGGAAVSVGSGFNNAYGVAVDGTGNVFVADGTNNAIKEVAAGTTTVATLSTSVNLPSCIIFAPAAITVPAPASTFYVADYNNHQVKKFSPVGGFFVDHALPPGLSINNTTGIISGTPKAAATGQDYIVYGYNTAGNNYTRVNITVNGPALPTISYATPQVYNVGTAITPLSPTETKVAAFAYSSNPSTLAYGLSTAEGIAVDASGNVFVTSNLGSTVEEYAPGNQSPTIIGSGFNLPAGIAVNSAGTLFIADGGNNVIKKIVGGTGTPTTLGSGFSNPAGVAFDATGNIYVADYGNNAVKRMTAAGGSITTLGSGFSHPFGIAVDAAGNIYVGDSGNKLVKMMPASGGTPVVIGSGFLSVYGIAVDHLGNVFVADFAANAIKEIPVGGGATVTIGAGIANPYAVAVDVAGNVYATDAGNNQAKQIKRVGGYYVNPVLPAGLSLSGTTGVISGTPTVATAAKNYNVSGFNAGGQKITPVNITVSGTTLSSNANLAGLALSSGTLSPVFAVATLSYTASVANAVTSVTVTPTTADATATVKVNGVAVTSGSPSANIALAVGPNVITTVVTAQNGTTTVTYTVTLTRAASSVATLSNLTIGSGALSPAFASATNSYTASVANTITGTTVTPTVTDPTATVTVNGTSVASGTASASIALAVGSNTITTIVTAQDGVTTHTYTITLTRAASTLSSNANLSNLVVSPGTLSPVFAAATTSYTVHAANTVTTVTVTPTTGDAGARVTVNGIMLKPGASSSSLPLAIGPNTVTIVVTAADGTSTKTYTVTVIRAASTNANLSTLGQSVGGLTPAFASATTSYTASVGNGIASMTLKPVSSDTNATIKVNGAAVRSGTLTAPIALSAGPNTVTTVVTAQDGTTTKTYTLTVTRAPSAIATLAGIKLSSGTLTPAFASATINYTASVLNSVATITIVPTTTEPNATVQVNGVATTSGAASAPIALAEGAQTAISTVVTAQDGVTTKTYTVTVTRAPSANANLSTLGQSIGGLTPAFSSATTGYTINAAGTVASITLKPVSSDAHATIKVNGTTVASGTVSGPIALAVGPNIITTVVTAQNGTTTQTYTLTVTRASGGADSYVPLAAANDISVTKPAETAGLADDGLLVHQSLSPNGDGINDFLQIDNIGQFPDNKLSIINRNGQLVYEAQGYDNSSKVFDGHSNKNGQMQLPGTYFYELDYTVKGLTKHKTGYIVLKY